MEPSDGAPAGCAHLKATGPVCCRLHNKCQHSTTEASEAEVELQVEDTNLNVACDKYNKSSRWQVHKTSGSSSSIIILIISTVLILQAIAPQQCLAQFLFTYEINQESDDSRAPKSSLFDPSSFKIVTPAQLQSSYQKLASQPPEQAPLTPPSSSSSASSSSVAQQDEQPAAPGQSQAAPVLDNFAPPTEASVSAGRQASSTAPSNSVGSSFLKQTSAAIQSFAELFNLSPSSSPSPLGLAHQHLDAEAPQSPPLALDQQAEARSLHEHWTQQQQKAHSAPAGATDQQHPQHGQLNPDHLPALQSFTTASSVGSQAAPSSPSSSSSSSSPSSQANSQASYWLTSNPLNGPDGNFLVEIKTVDRQQQQQEPQKLAPGENPVSNLVDNLLSIGQQQQQQKQQRAIASVSQLQHHQLQQHHAAPASNRLQQQQQQSGIADQAQPVAARNHHFGMPQQQQQQQHQQTPASLQAPAQSSFLATPTNYYPPPSPATSLSAPTLNERNSFRPPKPAASQQQHVEPSAVPSDGQSRNFNRQQQQQPQQQKPHLSGGHPAQQPAPASYLPQTQALHQHQVRSLSQQQQPARPSPQYQADLLLDGGQIQPPANAPSDHFGSQAAAAAAAQVSSKLSASQLNQYQAANHLGPAPPKVQQPQQLRSAEESLVAFRQQQQNQHDQQSALLANQQQLVADAQRNQQQQQSAGSGQTQHAEPSSGSGSANGVALGTREGDLQAGLGGQYYNPNGGYTHNAQQQQQQKQLLTVQPEVSSKSPLGDIPKVSPQIYESFLLQQKDQYEKHMELLKQQQELNKLLEQKQKEESEKSKQKQQRQASKKEELERQERAKKERVRAEQQDLQKQQAAAAARKARQEAAEALRKQAKLKQELAEKEERDKRQRALVEQEEEERRYRDFLAARQRQEEQQARQRELEAREAELKRQREQRDQQERDALEAQQKRRREQQLAAEQQQQYRNYLRQQEELKKLLELKEKEDEAVQATRRRQAAAAAAAATSTTTVSPPVTAQAQLAYSSNRTGAPSQSTISAGSSSSQSIRANRLALEHKERGRQLSRSGDSTSTGQRSGQSSQWGAPVRASRSRYAVASSTPSSSPLDSTDSGSSASSSNEQSAVSTSAAYSSSTLAPQTTSTSSSAGDKPSAAVVIKRARSGQAGAQVPKKLKAVDEKLIRQKIPLYSGAGKYGLYRSGSANDSFAELVALLESVTLPPSSTTTTTTTTTSTTTTSTTPAPSSDYSLDSSSEAPASDTSGGRRRMSQADSNMASSLSPLLNVRELSATPSPFAASTGEPLSSTTIFDDDVPRRPVRNLARLSSLQSSSSSQQQQTAASVASPTSVSSTGSVAGVERTSPLHQQLTHRTGSVLASPPAHQHKQHQQLTSGRASNGTHSGRTAHIGLASLPADSDNDGIPGRAGVEYPVLSVVPQTSFTCAKQPLNGYYADTETACQVVHLCQGGAQSSILCPNGTIFNQEKFSCQWWYEVNCSRAPMFYQLNDNLYKSATLTTSGASAAGSAADDKEAKAPSSSSSRELVRLAEQRKPRTRAQASTVSTAKESLNDL